MAKFIKFKISNAASLATAGDYARDVLVNIDDIENVADAVNTGVYTAVVTLKGIVGLDNEAAAATIGGRILTLTVSTSATTAVNPTPITVSGNMPSQAIIKAMTANPGGVAASAQLGLDGGGVRPADDQMYWSSAVFSSDNAL